MDSTPSHVSIQHSGGFNTKQLHKFKEIYLH